MLNLISRLANKLIRVCSKLKKPDRIVLEHYVLNMPSYSSVLAIGFNKEGIHLPNLRPDLFWISVDKNKNKVKLAKTSDYAIVCDVRSEDFCYQIAEERFDYVLFDGMLKSLDKDEALKAMGNLHKSLSPGGKLLIGTNVLPNMLRPPSILPKDKFELTGNFAGDPTAGISYFFWEYKAI
jgi:SAM-dependent methyltransferase